jgi:amino acid adenylation domain-containing protein
VENVEDVYPLSPLQSGILFHSLSAPAWDPYVQQLRVTLDGPLEADSLRLAWQAVLDRHAVLRTAFFWEELERPLQAVRRQVVLPWEGIDRSAGSDAELAEELDDLLRAERRAGFAFDRAPLLRIKLIRTAATRHVLVWTLHHLALDGWSMGIVLQDLLGAYQDLASGRAPELASPPAFRTFIDWLDRQPEGDAERFWRSELSGLAPLSGGGVHRAPAESLDPEPFGRIAASLGEERTGALRELARASRLTVGTIVLGAWALVEAQRRSRDDVAFGVTFSGRSAPLDGIDRMVGMFINTLPLRVAVDPEATCRAWLQELQRRQAALHRFEPIPLSRIRRWVGLEPSQTLFDSVVVFDNYPMGPGAGSIGRLRISDVTFHSPNHYPLTLKATDGADLHLDLKHDVRRIGRAEAEGLLSEVRARLDAFVAGPDAELGRSVARSGIGAGPARRVIADPGPAASVLDRVEATAAAEPDRIALVEGDRTVSYGELVAISRRFAARLRDHGVARDTLVAVLLERSIEMAIAWLSILRAGGAFVPLDPHESELRSSEMCRSIGVQLVITAAALTGRVAAAAPRIGISLLDPEASGDAIGPRRDAEDGLAYVMFTSGSTGMPKAVAVGHAQLSNYVAGLRERLGLAGSWSFASLGSPAADLGLTAVFGALGSGGTLRLIGHECALDGRLLAEDLQRRPVDVLKITPSHLRALLASAPEPRAVLPRRLLILGGEALSWTLLEEVRELAPGCRIVNHYGPTETTIGSATCEPHAPSASESGTVPVGTPLPGQALRLVAPDGRPAPPAEPGEIWIGGGGVTRGYLDRPDLTSARFLESEECGEAVRFYRTGDRARLLPDGSFEFLGRCDDEVKVRGFRVDLAEVERVVAAAPGVRGAAIAAHRPPDGDTRLVAFVVPRRRGATALASIRRFAEERLSRAGRPSQWVAVDAIPLTPSGKADRVRLGELATVGEAPGRRAAGRDVRRDVAVLWCELLGLDRVGAEDDFFDCGGHSLLAMKLVGRLRQRLGTELTVADFLKDPTVRAVVARVRKERRRAGAGSRGPRAATGRARPRGRPLVRGDSARGEDRRK